MNVLERLGWNAFWERSFASMQLRGFVPGRVTAQHKNSYRVYFENSGGAGGGCVIDTPGMRELQLWSAPDGMIHAFPKIAEVAARCRFDNCRHDTEPECAVKLALADGTLDPERFQNFHKLQRELEYLNSRQDPLLHAKRQQKVRLIHRQMRKIPPKRS